MDDILDIPYLGSDDNFIKEKKYTNCKLVLGIGQLQDSSIRKIVVEKYKKNGYVFPSIISNKSIISDDVNFGEGSIIRDGANIGPSTQIGNFTIIGNSVNLNHDVKIGNYNNIALGSNIGANVNIGHSVFIGMGSTIINELKIGNNIFIGAGSLVTKNLNESALYYGRPAQRIRNLK